MHYKFFLGYTVLSCLSVLLVSQEIDIKRDQRFNSVSWMQNAAEYRVATRQSYRLARMQLRAGLEDRNWTADEVQLAEGNYAGKKPAVILDVDETVLDNSPYNARGIVDGKSYSLTSWNEWVEEEKATAIPGALEFIKTARQLDVEVFYITNRRDVVRQATINNLTALGFPVDEEHLLTRNDDDNRGGDKLTRRATIAQDHRILLLIGDNLADICSGMDSPNGEARNATAKKKEELLGTRWILLPNPSYGGWERALPMKNEILRLARETELKQSDQK